MDIAQAAGIVYDEPTARRITAAAAMESAQHILMSEAASAHAKLANMLRVCADALPGHPEPIMLCACNADRLWQAMLAADQDGYTRKADDPLAADIHLASMAFERAADALRGAK